MIRPGSGEAYSRPGPAAAIASSRARNTRLVVASRMAGPGCHPTPRPGWSTQRRAMLTKWASTPCTGIVHRRWGRSSAAPGKRSRTSAGIVSGRWPRSSGRSARSSINWTPSRNREIASPCRSADDMSTPARSSRTRICLAHALSIPRDLARQSSQVTRGAGCTSPARTWNEARRSATSSPHRTMVSTRARRTMSVLVPVASSASRALTHACSSAARSAGCLVPESTMSSTAASAAHSAQQPGHSIRGIRAVNA